MDFGSQARIREVRTGVIVSGNGSERERERRPLFWWSAAPVVWLVGYLVYRQPGPSDLTTCTLVGSFLPGGDTRYVIYTALV